jgi:hypothetical protein
LTIAEGRAWLLTDRAYALWDHLCVETAGRPCPGDLYEARRWLERTKGLEPGLVESVLAHLAAIGGRCDCLAHFLLTHGEAAGPSGPLPEDPALAGWCLPAGWRPTEPGRSFTKLLRMGPAPLGHGYARDGELLVPAPGLCAPGRSIRPWVHFFLGLETALPSEHGIVRVEREPWTAARLAAAVRASKATDPLDGFGELEASFFLEAIDRVEAGRLAGVKILRVLSKDTRVVPELSVARVIPRRLHET